MWVVLVLGGGGGSAVHFEEGGGACDGVGLCGGRNEGCVAFGEAD